MTLREAILVAADRFRADPYVASSAARDAELLLLHTLALSRTALYTDPQRPLTPGEYQQYTAAIDRRLAHEPIQYIVGSQEFFGLALRVTPATLIPRPETELLVEAVLQVLPRDRDLEIADVGTGSGAIAIVLAKHLPRARLTALDLSPAALAIAEENARTHCVHDRIHFSLSDLLEQQPTRRFDAVVSNPPYVPETDRPSLDPEVREHEPGLALFAGPDGLSVYRRLIPEAAQALVPGGLLALEIGAGQRLQLPSLLSGWRDLDFLPDMQGIARVCLARTPPARVPDRDTTP